MTFTKRYANNLLRRGANNEFTITSLVRKYAMVQELQVGFYYEIEIRDSANRTGKWVGVTPEQATTNCLHHFHGVTFR